jgi:ubiquinone/menaquinone biosynthesis C-methylase UbiE
MIETSTSSLLPYLSCPLCKGDLKNIGANQIECLSCKLLYSVDDGIPILLPPQLEEFKKHEAEYHSKEAAEYAERNMKFSYRVVRYHEDYLNCFRDCRKGALVLEVGGGDGLEAAQLINIGLTVIQSDIAVGMVKTARKNTASNGLYANSVYVVCDAEQLPCKDQSLDAVLIVAALHHLPSPERFFNAAKRALKPGGLLVIGFEPNRWPYFTIYPALRMLSKVLNLLRNSKHGEPSVGDMETTGFTEADFENFLRTEGLEKMRLQRIWYVNGFIHTALTAVNNKLPTGKSIDLPYALQRVLVVFDDFMSRIPLLRRLCWHWTLVAQRPK